MGDVDVRNCHRPSSDEMVLAADSIGTHAKLFDNYGQIVPKSC